MCQGQAESSLVSLESWALASWGKSCTAQNGGPHRSWRDALSPGGVRVPQNSWGEAHCHHSRCLCLLAGPLVSQTPKFTGQGAGAQITGGL